MPVVIALNKVDRLKPSHIAQQMQAAANLGPFHALHPVSAKTGDGIAELRSELVGLLPEGPLYFPLEQKTDLTVEAQIGELIRKGGSMVREIGTKARPEIEALLGHPIYLELMVKVRPHWRRNDAILERLGL